MNCFIRSLKLLTGKTEQELKELIQRSGIDYDSLTVKGMRLEQTWQIMFDLGFLFYNNLSFNEKICASNPLFDKGEYVFIYSNHAMASVNRQYSDGNDYCLNRQMYGFFYRPIKFETSIKETIVQMTKSNQFDYIGHGQNRVVFRVAENMLCKIAITDAGHEENLYDLYQANDEYYATCFFGNDAFIVQEELRPDNQKKFESLMTKLAYQRGYDKCQYGLTKGRPKFYDAKLSTKSCETLKLRFDETDLGVLNEWLTTKTNESFIEYYRRNA